MSAKRKAAMAALYTTPTLGGTLAGLLAMKLGIDPTLVVMGAAALSQVAHAVAAKIHKGSSRPS
jgi:hypothetical protein